LKNNFLKRNFAVGVKISGKYLGNLAMSMVHGPSGVSIQTDPPVDNGGKGLSFSPTDLLATAAVSCMTSVMAIFAEREKINLKGMSCEVEKHMSTDTPRRVSRLDLVIFLPAELSLEQRDKLEKIAYNCPVLLSLNPEIHINKRFIYGES
jgi:uncharacterized OsmC-like protein